MKNKNIILWVIGFIIFLVVVYLGYNELSSIYEENKSKENEEIAENIPKNEEENNEDTKVEALDFTVYDEADNQVKLSDYMGTPVVLNFWASWCPPCKEEMPHFKNAADKYGEDVTILMINMTDGQRETVESAKKFMVDNGYDMTTLYDKDLDAAMKYKISGIPRTVFIDKDGFIEIDRVGIVNEEFLNDMIERIKK